MKILFVTPYVPSLIRVRPYQFIRELSKQGHDVSILSAGAGWSEAEADDLRRYCRRLEIVPMAVSTGLRSCAAAAVRGDPLQAAICHGPALDRRLRDLLAQDRFDVVHVEHLRAARLVNLLPPDLPRLFDAVDSISLLLERTLRSSHSLRQRALALVELRRTRTFEGRILPRFDQTIVTSSDDAAVLQHLAPTARVRVVPNGVDQAYFRPLGGPREPATLVFSGKMSYHANVTAILHFVRAILPLIRSARPDVRLWIVGSHPSRAVRELARDPGIVVTGHVPDIRPFVGRASVAVCPMVVKVGIQNKLLEAMAMATPTVATRAGASGLSAEPGRELLVADDAAEFAEQVLRLLGGPARALALGEAGHAYVQRHHAWATAARSVSELYTEAVAQRAHETTVRGRSA